MRDPSPTDWPYDAAKSKYGNEADEGVNHLHRPHFYPTIMTIRYEKPDLKIIDVTVENGFAATDLNNIEFGNTGEAGTGMGELQQEGW